MALFSESQYWNKVARRWTKAPTQKLWRKHSDDVNASLFSNWMQGGNFQRALKTDLFDEAVGTGLCGLLLSRCGQVVGMDISKNIVFSRRVRGIGIAAICADVRALPFADKIFDAVLSNSTLDHFSTINEIFTSLRELNRVLRLKGRLFLTIDNKANLFVAIRQVPFIKQILIRTGIVPYEVGVNLTRKNLRTLLESAGFSILELTSVLHCPRVFAVAAAKVFENMDAPSLSEALLKVLRSFERLSSWPTRFITGHFLAVNAVKTQNK